ncbi:MAG: Hpt domain-containing protein [Eubacteriales bacterium]
MNIEECYEKLGGDYADVRTRLPSRSLVEKFIDKFLEDKSYETLCQQIECGNREASFRAAHTLKGISANLSFSRLFASASRLTEELRPETSVISDKTIELLNDVRRDYELTCDTIRRYLGK